MSRWKKCSVDGCHGVGVRHGYCWSCYWRLIKKAKEKAKKENKKNLPMQKQLNRLSATIELLEVTSEKLSNQVRKLKKAFYDLSANPEVYAQNATKRSETS